MISTRLQPSLRLGVSNNIIPFYWKTYPCLYPYGITRDAIVRVGSYEENGLNDNGLDVWRLFT